MEQVDLPGGWEWRALGDPEVAHIGPRKSELRKMTDDILVSFVPMDAVSEVSGSIIAPQQRPLGQVRSGYTYFADGDVIFAKITPCMENGKSATATDLMNGIGFGSTEFLVFRPGPKSTSQWLHCLLRSKILRSDAQTAMTGAAGQQRVPRDFLASYKIPLPPLPEQKRIVARIDALTRRLGEILQAQTELEHHHRRLLGAYYQKIIEEAQWHPMVDVAPLVRRPVRVEAGETYAELGIRSFGKGTFHKPALTAGQLGRKRIYRMEPGDLVFNNVFAWECAVAVVKSEDAGRVGSHRFITCVPKPRVATAPFLYHHFTTEKGMHDLGDASPGGAGRNRTLGLNKLHAIKVPIPAYEQQLVFATLWEKVESAKILQASVADNLTTFIPSLLSQAFRGEL